MAIRAMNAAAVNGTWVLLQNCELGLGLMNEMEASGRGCDVPCQNPKAFNCFRFEFFARPFGNACGKQILAWKK